MHFGRKSSSIFTLDPAAPTSTGFSFARLRFASRLRIHATSRFCLVRSSIVQTFDRLVRALRSRSLVACACVRLLGPCFKTGRLGRSHQSRRLALLDAAPSPRLGPGFGSSRRRAPREGAAASGVERPRPEPGRSRLTSTSVIDGRPSARKRGDADRASDDRVQRRLAHAVSLLSDGFAASLTLSSECFSTFPRGTCALSVSRSVSSLGWSEPPGFGLRSQTTRLSNQRAV